MMGFAELVIGPATSGRTRWLNLFYGQRDSNPKGALVSVFATSS